MTTATAPSPARGQVSLRAPARQQRGHGLDFSHPLAFAALAILFVASRAPFLGIGYGTDPDAWRVALTGYWLWEHHEYFPSRLPGYPLPELASALVYKGGPLASNGLTMLVSLAGVWFFARIAAKLDLPHRGLVVAGFAFTPLLWINSMTTMDYMWALTFSLGAYFFVLRHSSFAAGLMLGLAVASRSTAVLLLIPCLIYIWRDGRRAEIRPFVVTVVAVALAAWAPVYWKYDLKFLTFYDSEVGYLSVLRLLAKDCLGLIGAAAVVAAAAASLSRLARLPRDAFADKDVMFQVLAIGVTAASFARLPHEAAYLIPIYPFGLLLMARYFRPMALTGAIAAIVLAGFADLTSPGEEISLSALAHSRPGAGLVLSNRDTMQKQIDFVRDVERLDVPEHTVVSLGFVYPIFAVRNADNMRVGIQEPDLSSISQLSDKGRTDDVDRQIMYVWLLEFDAFERLRSDGWRFMYTQDAGRSTAALYDYRPGLYGAREIDLGRSPTGGSGAARTDR